MRLRTGTLIGLASLLFASAAWTQGHPPPKKIQVADGVYVFVTPGYGEVGLDGNSVVIVSTDGVLVFDSNGTPAAATAVLGEIRRLTDQPVKYLVHSHWHWDHWYGAEVYRRAFPGLHVVTHAKTRALMSGPALEFNRPGLETQLPGYVQSLEKRVSAARAATPPPTELPVLEERLQTARFFLEQKRSVSHVLADVTFTERLTIHLGEREVQVLHYDRAVTPGDAFLYLPQDKLLVTGDLLVNPISFALGCYPSGWLAALERLAALDAATIVPGHGEPLHDKRLLEATTSVLRELLRQGKDARSRGLDPDQARAEISPRLASLRAAITGGDARLDKQFEVYLVDWFLHRVYDELAGPLTDAIAPPPAS